MTTIGWLFVLIALFIGRAFTKGRTIDQSFNDMGDIVTALLTNDRAKLSDALARSGSAFVADPSNGLDGQYDTTNTTMTSAGTHQGNQILAEAEKLGRAAKGYRTGGTGPTYYDCSGLVWRALKNLNIFTGPRFTTFTFTSTVKCTQISRGAANVGDIVLWNKLPTHHMGIVSGISRGTGAVAFYSARNPRSGISVSTIDGFAKTTPTFWRVG